MNARFFDWIWQIKGTLALAPGQSNEEAFDRLDPLFREAGTSHQRTRDTLTFRKRDQAAQDKMSVFNDGVLQIENGAAGAVLRYRLNSRALLLCFLAPLLFLGFAGLSIGIGILDKPTKAEMAEAKKKGEEKEKKLAEMPQNPIDKFLGAPAPEKPEKKDDKKKSQKDKDKAEEEEDAGEHSPTPAYVLAGLFAFLYVVGRILEGRLIKALFRKKLLGQ